MFCFFVLFFLLRRGLLRLRTGIPQPAGMDAGTIPFSLGSLRDKIQITSVRNPLGDMGILDRPRVACLGGKGKGVFLKTYEVGRRGMRDMKRRQTAINTFSSLRSMYTKHFFVILLFCLLTCFPLLHILFHLRVGCSFSFPGFAFVPLCSFARSRQRAGRTLWSAAFLA